MILSLTKIVGLKSQLAEVMLAVQDSSNSGSSSNSSISGLLFSYHHLGYLWVSDRVQSPALLGSAWAYNLLALMSVVVNARLLL